MSSLNQSKVLLQPLDCGPSTCNGALILISLSCYHQPDFQSVDHRFFGTQLKANSGQQLVLRRNRRCSSVVENECSSPVGAFCSPRIKTHLSQSSSLLISNALPLWVKRKTESDSSDWDSFQDSTLELSKLFRTRFDGWKNRHWNTHVTAVLFIPFTCQEIHQHGSASIRDVCQMLSSEFLPKLRSVNLSIST